MNILQVSYPVKQVYSSKQAKSMTLNPQIICIYFLMLSKIVFMVQDLKTPSEAYQLKIKN
jgi:hypothetical protein